MPGFDVDSIVRQARTENFPVASFLLPRSLRSHLQALYGFARLADDIGDEAEGDRLLQLDWLSDELDRAQTGSATHPLLRRLTPTLHELDLPLEPFHHLIEANRADQVVSRYETFDQLLEYCRLSAVPVGRLVLLIFGSSSPERVFFSDDICIGLQLAEFLQDVREDASRGRVYLPTSELSAYGVAESDLSAAHATPALQRLIAVYVARARRLLGSGTALTRSLSWPQSTAVAGFAGGGLATLDAIQHAGYDVLGVHCRPKPLRTGIQMAAMHLGGPRGQTAA